MMSSTMYPRNPKDTSVDELYYRRTGGGEPLLLIHGLGADHRSWDRLVPYLSEFDVIAVDLPGHGRSPRIPRDLTPTPEYLRDRLVDLLDQLGIADPHVAGNSLGGWLTLELGRVGRARSLTLLGPAGLWSGRDRVLNRALFPVGRMLAEKCQPLARIANRTAIGRTAILAAFSARPWAVPTEEADTLVAAFGESSGFYAVRKAVHATRFRAGRDIAAPVTVAFGTKDRLLPPRAQLRDELPTDAVWTPLPECGHVPMIDDPALVAETIRETVRRTAN
jgi:pimeloyl-ACP methyl ester carboxylesterase